jgi:hypothetical protein
MISEPLHLILKSPRAEFFITFPGIIQAGHRTTGVIDATSVWLREILVLVQETQVTMYASQALNEYKWDTNCEGSTG